MKYVAVIPSCYFRHLFRSKGVPLDTADEMYVPYSYPNRGTSLSFDTQELHSKADHARNLSAPNATQRPKREKRRPSFEKNRIIPVDEDIRRLFQECTIGQGNARLLFDNLTRTKWKDSDRDTILKVRISLEF
jgi:hypothetical protein